MPTCNNCGYNPEENKSICAMCKSFGYYYQIEESPDCYTCMYNPMDHPTICDNCAKNGWSQENK